MVYIDGRAESIPLHDACVDVVLALTATMYPLQEVIPAFIKEARRIARTGGLVISVDVAPRWYGGELSSVIDDLDADTDLKMKHRLFVDEAGFSYFDVDQKLHIMAA